MTDDTVAVSAMQQLTAPSNRFWTITPFHLDVPADWEALQTVDHLMYTSSPDGTSSCGVQWKRVPSGLGLPQIADMNFANVRRVDADARVLEAKPGKLNGVKSVMRVCEYQADDRKLAQLYFAAHGPKFGPDQPIELFEIVSHFPAGDASRFRELVAISSTFRFALQAKSIDSPAELDRTGA